MKEYEQKIFLSKDEYFALLELYDNSFEARNKIVVNHINHYYDNEKFSLYNSKETLRVRQIGEELVLQQKTNKKYINSIRSCDECELSLDYLPSRIQIKDDLYDYIGCMFTIRRNFSHENILVSLDENIYLGVVDYELEIEGETIADIESYIHKLNHLAVLINVSTNFRGKYSRFIHALNSIKGIYKCNFI